MNTVTELAAVEQAVSGIAAAFAADGYRLTVVDAEPEVRLTIDVVGNDCADCLVPESVLVPMIAQALDGTIAARRPIQVRYPSRGTG